MNKVDPIQHFNDISDNLKAIRAEIQNGITSEEADDLKKDFLKAEFLAYKIKLGISLGSLYQEQPDLPIRDVLIHVFPDLRADITPELIPVLTQFIMEEWEVKSRKLAA